MSSCSLCDLAPDNGADHRTSAGDEQLLCLLSHPACCLEVHSPRKAFASGLSALLSSEYIVALLSHVSARSFYKSRFDCYQSCSQWSLLTGFNKGVFILKLFFGSMLLHDGNQSKNLAYHFFKSEVSLVSHYILKLPCLYCWCPSGCKPGDTSCNESLLNADIFSPGFGFGSSLVRCSLTANHHHINGYCRCTETSSGFSAY